jgi:hypothetical protein
MRILVERSNRRARELLGDTYAADHLAIGDEKSFRAQGKQRVFQCVKQSRQELATLLLFFRVLILFGHCNTRLLTARRDLPPRTVRRAMTESIHIKKPSGIPPDL